MNNIAVFASGTGSNFVAIYSAIQEHKIDANLALLICDKPEAAVILKAEVRNIPVWTNTPKHYPTKKQYEEAILQELHTHHVHFIVLAGYMRLIGPTILHNYQHKIINIHPSLLPSFPGLDAVGQAMNAGVKVTGVTVHYVDEGMDTGTIIAQQALDISKFHTRDKIETEIHKIEHELYPKVIQQLLEERK